MLFVSRKQLIREIESIKTTLYKVQHRLDVLELGGLKADTKNDTPKKLRKSSVVRVCKRSKEEYEKEIELLLRGGYEVIEERNTGRSYIAKLSK